MHTVDEFWRLIENKGITKFHRKLQTRAYVAVSIIVGRICEKSAPSILTGVYRVRYGL